MAADLGKGPSTGRARIYGSAMLCRLLAAAAAVCVGLTTAGCVSEVTGNEEPRTIEPVEPDDMEQARDRNREMEQQFAQEYQDQDMQQTQQTWVCAYSVTYDYDWHNDVLCSNGSDRQRPYLRSGDAFVTQSELMQTAQAYEEKLNGGRR